MLECRSLEKHNGFTAFPRGCGVIPSHIVLVNMHSTNYNGSRFSEESAERDEVAERAGQGCKNLNDGATNA